MTNMKFTKRESRNFQLNDELRHNVALPITLEIKFHCCHQHMHLAIHKQYVTTQAHKEKLRNSLPFLQRMNSNYQDTQKSPKTLPPITRDLSKIIKERREICAFESGDKKTRQVVPEINPPSIHWSVARGRCLCLRRLKETSRGPDKRGCTSTLSARTG